MAYGPEHLFSSYSLLDLAVTEPFLAKTIVQNSNLGIIIREIVIKSAGHFRRIPVWTTVVRQTLHVDASGRECVNDILNLVTRVDQGG